MKVLYVHNEYARPSGEEHAAHELVALLREHGHVVGCFSRSSAEIADSLAGKVKALLAGVYNPFSARRLAHMLDDFEPDIVQVQNLYPLLSASIFAPMRERGIPVVMRCPNYRLFCPSGLSLAPSGNVCERCWGGHELNCIRLNCLGSRSRSIGYAARNAFGRVSRMILDGVDMFITQSEFQKEKFIGQGIPEHKIGVLPGISPVINIANDGRIGEFVSFVGRVSAEKGIYEFIETARQNPGIPFKVAGNIDAKFDMPSDMPANLEFVGFRKGDDLDRFYLDSRIIVVPSKWYEGFPNVITRGMLLCKPVVTTSIGAMQSIIDHGENGLLVAPGDAVALSAAIGRLYPDKETCRRMGERGYEKATASYSRRQIYDTLMQIYDRAVANRKNSNEFVRSR